MTSLRRHIHRSFRQAAMLILAALIVRALVPAGYMPDIVDGAFVMRPCDGQSAGAAMMNAAMPAGDHAHAGHQHDPGDSANHAKFATPCAFSGLATPSLAGVDPILLATAIAFVLAMAFRAAETPVLSRDAHLRPPPQGPPITA